MTKIAFTGDVAFSKHFEGAATCNTLLSDNIIKFLSSSDYTVVNMEGAVSNAPKVENKPLTHANPFESVELTKKINGNIWNLANNHLMDCGLSGLESTLEVAKSNNISIIGAGINLCEAANPIIINEDGGIGIIAVTYFRQNRADSNNPGCFIAEDEEEVKRKIREIKTKNRWCIVISHVGQEFSQMPMPYLRKRYKRYLKYGADIVVGHHSHVVQNYEEFGDKVVFYSLGNFIFDTDYQRVQRYTDYGMLLKIDFNGEKYSWDYLPVKNNRDQLRISEYENPEIFCNIGKIKYNFLWPLAARHLYKNEKKKNIFNHLEYSSRSWFDWLIKFDLKRLNKPMGRDIILGRFLSLFQFWRFTDRKLVNYIREGE